MIERTVNDLSPVVGTRPACRALGASVATVYRHRKAPAPRTPKPRPTPARALTEPERAEVLQVLDSDRFVDVAPQEVYATLLDEGTYLCSERTMYRILAADHGSVRERRSQLTHPAYARPELLATRPNQLWSWDISRLRGPAKFTYYYLYLILDVFSRYITGWTVDWREHDDIARDLMAQAAAQQGIQPHMLTLHADNGQPMRSKTLSELLCDLGVERTHSRPHTSNDNPYSEAAFKTMKYRPDFPDRFDSIDQARHWCRTFVHWYNGEHRHGGIGLMTPAAVHYGHAQAIYDARAQALTAAYLKHPERFVGQPPVPPALPTAAWINKPQEVTP